jgi:hypothetical protein
MIPLPFTQWFEVIVATKVVRDGIKRMKKVSLFPSPQNLLGPAGPL